jgi:hypothetical protein
VSLNRILDSKLIVFLEGSRSLSSFRFLETRAATSDEFGRQVWDTLGRKIGEPNLSLMGDLLREILAEKGEICNWKLRLDAWICSRILSKVLEATIVGFTPELIISCMLLSIKIKHLLPHLIHLKFRRFS